MFCKGNKVSTRESPNVGKTSQTCVFLDDKSHLKNILHKLPKRKKKSNQTVKTEQQAYKGKVKPTQYAKRQYHMPWN